MLKNNLFSIFSTDVNLKFANITFAVLCLFYKVSQIQILQDFTHWFFILQV